MFSVILLMGTGSADLSASKKKQISLEKQEVKKVYAFGKWCVKNKIYWIGCEHLELCLKDEKSKKGATKLLAQYGDAEQEPVDEETEAKLEKKKSELYAGLVKRWTTQKKYASKKKDTEAETYADQKIKKYSKQMETSGDRIELDANQVQKIINEKGSTNIDWLEAESLNFPKTIKMNWPEAVGKWNQKVNIGQYIWSTINENPRRWKSGTKFMHHVLEINQGNTEIEGKCYGALGHCYHDLHMDWARGAFWWSKSKNMNVIKKVSLANCYWQLGSKDLASKTLTEIPYDNTRYGSVIKLWSDMDELDKALAVAEKSGGAGSFTAAGDACLKHGEYEQAKTYFQKTLAISGSNGVLTRNKERSQLSLDHLEFIKTFELSKIKNGVYRGSVYSYNAPITAKVTVKYGKIENVEIENLKDKQYYASVIDMSAKIIKKQSVKNIHATTGATVTSEAIIHAATKALQSGLK